MTALLKIDQAGLSAGVAGRSRTDGLATGALVTLTNTGSGTTLMRLLWAPPGDTTALSSLAVTGDPKVWTFSPTASKYGSYLVELIADQGLVTEKRERRVLVVRTPNRKLVIPALNERGDNAASLLAAGQEQVEASNNNAVDYLDATLNGVPYAGWWRAIHEMMMALDTGIAGSNLVGIGQVLGLAIDAAAGGPALPLSGAKVGELTRFEGFEILSLTAGTYDNVVVNAKTSTLFINATGDVTITSFVHGSSNVGADFTVVLNSASGRLLFPHYAIAGTNRIFTPSQGTFIVRTVNGSLKFRHAAGAWRLGGIEANLDMPEGRLRLRALGTGAGPAIDGTAAQLDAIMRTVAGVQRVVSVDTTLQTWTNDSGWKIAGGSVAVPTSPAGTAYRIRVHVTMVYSSEASIPVLFRLRYGATEELLVTLDGAPQSGTYHARVEGHVQLLGSVARMFMTVETTRPATSALKFASKSVAIGASSLSLEARMSPPSSLVTITVDNAYIERLY